jgi:hypothetical protein
LPEEEADVVDDNPAVIGFNELRDFKKVHQKCPEAGRTEHAQFTRGVCVAAI